MEEWNPLYTSTVWLIIVVLATAAIQGEKWSVRRAKTLSRAGRPLTASQKILAHGDSGTGIITGKGELARELTERDLLLGRRAARIFNVYTLSSMAVMAAIAVFVWFSVPLDTSIHFSDNSRKPERMNVIPAMLPAIIICAMLMKGPSQPDAGHMGGGGRKVLYILGTLMVTWALYLQLTIAIEALVTGGALTL